MKRNVKIYLGTENLELFREMALARDLSLSAWLVQAGLSYARSAKRSFGKNAEAAFWPSGWKKSVKCHVCGKFHDPKEAHAELGDYDEFEREQGQVRE